LPCDLRQQNGNWDLIHPNFGIQAAGGLLGQVLSQKAGQTGKVLVGIRPEDVKVFAEKPSGEAIPAKVSVVEPLGAETIVDIKLGTVICKATVPPTQKLAEQQAVWISFDPAKLHVLDIVTEMRLYSSSQTDLLPVRSNQP
jgi:ABC-type sugar transport system ATPase subunit